LKTIFPFN